MGFGIELPAAHTLQVTTTAGSVFVRRRDDTTIAAVARLNESVTFGPYARAKSFDAFPDDRAATVWAWAATEGDGRVPASSIGDMRDLSGSGAPDDGLQSTLDRNPTGDDNALTFTAVEYGAGGDTISIAYIDPGANDATLAVTVEDRYIAVSLATGGAGAITSTAAEVLAAIEASVDASRLVTVAIDTADTGTDDDGSGIVTALSRAYMSGGAGTGVGIAGPGSRYTDTDDESGVVYINTGTKAAPVWAALATV